MDNRRRSTNAGIGDEIMRTISRTFSGKSRQDEEMERYAADEGADTDSAKTKVEDWRLANDVKQFQLNDPTEGRRLGVTWSGLTVKVVPSDARLQENVLSQFNIPQQVKESRQKPELKTILDNSFGSVRPGEMLLVLGRPGSGCTTLLKMLANKRKGYAEIAGDVHYGSMNAKEAANYRGSIVINTEEELFFPTLTVGKTMDFATKLNIPQTLPKDATSPEDFRQKFKSFLMESMGIAHTEDTKVGDAFVRGVSGGERKRVSIIETLANRAAVACWDNSTRGLDASTADRKSVV